MSILRTDAERNVWNTISDLHDQLNATFKSNQIVNDYALLNGFLTFIDSKLSRMIAESFQAQQEIYLSGSNAAEIDEKSVPLILRLFWEKICHPIFKWFQAWRLLLLPKDHKEQRKYVELRKMNSKLIKFFKSVHKFHYRIIEDILNKYETSAVIPTHVVKELNVEKDDSAKNCDKIALDAKNKFTVLIVISLHSCLLNLGTSHRYKSLVEKFSNNYSIQDFKKSLRYLDLASLMLPSIGESHLQKGLIYVQTENLSTAVYEFTRSALTRIPSPAGQANFATIVSEKESKLHKKVCTLLNAINNQDLSRSKIVNREIIEYYFLALFGSQFAPNCWLDSSRKQTLQNGIRLDYLKSALSEKMNTRHLKNIDSIFENLIVVIGGFDLLLSSDKPKSSIDSKTRSLKTLNENDLAYLEFAFRFITEILKIVKEAWQLNLDKYQYLAMIRVIECWLKSNRAVLQYSHRDETFCEAFAVLLNDIAGSGRLELESLTSHRPRRPYYMKEDVYLKEFSTIKYAMTDFNDAHIFSMDNSIDRLAGFPLKSEKLDASIESKLRLQAIFVSGRKFLAKNGCGIVWASPEMKFEIPRKQKNSKSSKSQTWASVLSRNQAEVSETKGRKIATQKEGQSKISLAELNESQFGQSSKIVYSGSSAPMAPPTFAVKPSSNLTQSILQQSSSIMSENREGEQQTPELVSLNQESTKLLITDANDIGQPRADTTDQNGESLLSVLQSNQGISTRFISQPETHSFVSPSIPHNFGFNSQPVAPGQAEVAILSDDNRGLHSYLRQLEHSNLTEPLKSATLREAYANNMASIGWVNQYPHPSVDLSVQLQQHGMQQHSFYNAPGANNFVQAQAAHSTSGSSSHGEYTRP